MSQIRHVGIAGTGHYVPERVVPNDFFAQYTDTNDEWIRKRTGIRERRFLGDDMATSDMCIIAARRALEAAGTDPAEVDLVVVGTISPDQYVPAAAPIIQHELGITNTAAFDVGAACAGFLTALQVGESFIAAGRGKKALVLGAETLSRFIDFSDRGSCILFGDGAGAVLLQAQEEGEPGEILKVSLGCDGGGYDFIQMAGGGSKRPASFDTVEGRMHTLRVKGRDVYRFAVTTMERSVREMLEGYDMEELGHLVPHQVNLRIIESAVSRLEIPMEKVVINIEKYGNTSAGSVPIALDEAARDGTLERGKLVVMTAFGAGLVWGGALVRW
jgi:3-oxoacyl-[acyl-carrier-protein] synthase III